MKKVIKNYLAKLQENDKKGFSLVELIIVMAIMAILVGVVASQVLPYMEKSRQSKDQQQLSSLCTDIVSAISQAESAVGDFDEDLTNCTTATGGADWVTQLGLLRSSDGSTIEKVADIQADLTDSFKSSKATTTPTVHVSYDHTSGKVTVYCAGGTIDKLKVVSE